MYILQNPKHTSEGGWRREESRDRFSVLFSSRFQKGTETTVGEGMAWQVGMLLAPTNI
jgi:hypothetical protein